MWATEWFMKAQIEQLEEENKRLNIIIENTKTEQEADRKHIEQLEEENKKLKIEIWWVMWERDGKQMRIDELEEELRVVRELYKANVD